MAKTTKRPLNKQKEGAQEFVRQVLENVFGQKPSRKTIAALAEKIVKSLPQKAA